MGTGSSKLTEIGDADQKVGDDELRCAVEAISFLLDELEVIFKIRRT